MIDSYLAVVTDLQHKRAAIDQVLDGLRLLASSNGGSGRGGHAAPIRQLPRGDGRGQRQKKKPGAQHPGAAAPKPPPIPKLAPLGAQGRRPRTDPALVAEARRLYVELGMNLAKVATATKIPYGTLYAIKSKEKWTATSARPLRNLAENPAKKMKMRDPGYMPSGAD